MKKLVRVALVHAGERGLGQLGLDLHDGLRAGAGGGGRLAEQAQHGGDVLQVAGRGFPGTWRRDSRNSRGREGRGRRRRRRRSRGWNRRNPARSRSRTARYPRPIPGGCAPAGRAGPRCSGARRFRPAAVGEARRRPFRRRPHPCRRRSNRRSSVRWQSSPRSGFGRFFQDAPEVPLIVVAQLGVDVPARLVGRDGVQLIPVAAGEAVEIDAGVGGPVEELGIEAGCVGQGSQGAVLRQEAGGNEAEKKSSAHGEKGITGDGCRRRARGAARCFGVGPKRGRAASRSAAPFRPPLEQFPSGHRWAISAICRPTRDWGKEMPRDWISLVSGPCL